jgi:hypothetical protein
VGNFYQSKKNAPRCFLSAAIKKISAPLISPHLQVSDVMILKIFSPKKLAKIFAFLTQNKAKLCKNLIITLVFEKNANFFA